MSAQADLSKLSVGQFAERFRGEMIPLSNTFSYYCAASPLTEEDMKEYLEEPIAALPPAIAEVLPKISIMLVPYLERVNEKGKGRRVGEFVSNEKPPQSREFWASQVHLAKDKGEVLLFALKDQEVAEYHYRFYQMLAALMGDRIAAEAKSEFVRLLREELNGGVHGEVDEDSWRLKQTLLRRPAGVTRDSKLFRDYVRVSLVDTLTLYLHGICCDIDVDTGPRQLASRHLRKRLNLLRTLYPPPDSYAVFPEDLKQA